MGCDNTLACTALGKTEDSDWLLRLDRGAGDAPVRVSLVDVPASGPAAIRLVVDGQARGPALRLSDAAEGVRRAPLPPAEVPAILAALRDGRTGGVMGPDARLLGTLPMGGYAAALRWMDARQGRAGTPGAVIATGNGTAP
ncbi:MAG: DUF1176 domain-containing protein, partial [Acetobacteraceae bacterium]|nr:DUF1176 domain-containing protein [Acetobacteraceae bacterium]